MMTIISGSMSYLGFTSKTRAGGELPQAWRPFS